MEKVEQNNSEENHKGHFRQKKQYEKRIVKETTVITHSIGKQ